MGIIFNTIVTLDPIKCDDIDSTSLVKVTIHIVFLYIVRAMTFHWLNMMIIYLFIYVPLKNILLMWRRHHYRWRTAKFRHMLGIQGLWTGRDLYHATSAVTILTRILMGFMFHRIVKLDTRKSHDLDNELDPRSLVNGQGHYTHNGWDIGKLVSPNPLCKFVQYLAKLLTLN